MRAFPPVLLLLCMTIITVQCRGQEGYVGNEACATCHAEITNSYSKTAMARASGLAKDAPATADFMHAPSGVHYRIFADEGKLWLSYVREKGAPLSGKKELVYYIGSGKRGRTYLFAKEGFYFEAPINWYGERKVWDMAPAYQDAKHAPLDLPAYENCLLCHMGEVPRPISNTENKYQAPLTTHSGITCERCHGAGAAHVKGGPIVNPAKVTAEKRDSICYQCHFEASAEITLAGKRQDEYRAGSSLFDYDRFFMTVSGNGEAMGAASQVQSLVQSRCKRESGDKMTCTTCHDPHASPSPEQRVAFYRGKCLSCHTDAFAAKHHPDNPDCTSCHMPPKTSSDVAHTEVTDHRILRKPSSAHASDGEVRLVSLPVNDTNVRDVGLAWAFLYENGMKSAQSAADRNLTVALHQGPKMDATALCALGKIKQAEGDDKDAKEYFEDALKQDPQMLDAEMNLGMIEGREGDLAHAVPLWTDVFARAPARSEIGVDLALAYCVVGHYDESRKFVERVLTFNPDMPEARELEKKLEAAHPKCGL